MPRLWLKEQLRKQQEDHQKRMIEVQSTIHDKRGHKHATTSRDRERERIRKQLQIAEENRSILDRLGRAMTAKRIDNDPSPHRLESIGLANRRRNLKRITSQNVQMLRRIQSVEPHYNRMKWDLEHFENDRILR
jgi:hypothetical protein